MVHLQFLVVFGLTAFLAFSAEIAIIDSGLDYKHRDLVQNVWTNLTNPVQSVDVDGKKYVDDLHGWNFAENNNQVIDYKYLGKFSQDCFKIFQIQVKVISGTATDEERAWYKAKKDDKAFIKELQKFGNFVHGTHVAGISTHSAEDGRVIAMKIIPTEVPGGQSVADMANSFRILGRGADNALVKMFLSQLATRQAKLLETVGKYTRAVKAAVANGSFGTSVPAVIPAIKPLLTQLLGHEPTEEESKSYATFFVDEVVRLAKDFTGASKTTLFVFAAGNDGGDNDLSPVSPANVKTDNSITVAATLGRTSLASFSNYGVKMVEVAAPGVGIESTIPGDLTLPMSGTSMAAPYVTQVAGKMKDANPNLTPLELKKVLMGTVDTKPFLAGKVSSGGVVNLRRAVTAAELSLKMGIGEAITQAKAVVNDEPTPPPAIGSEIDDLIAVPLPMPIIR